MLAIVMLFAMVFTTGFGYLLFVNQTNQSVDQANSARQNSLIQSGLESLTSKVTLSGKHLMLYVNNTGGVPATISSVGIKDSTGTLSPLGFLGPTGTNVTSARWPITLQVGQSTKSLRENINLTSYVYVPGTTVTVDVVTARGNSFGAVYPPITAAIVSGNALVVVMTARPPQTLTCSNCITLNVTVYNYALSQVSNVQLSPYPPAWSVTGTATLLGGSCTNPSSTTIQAYKGSGNAHKISWICNYGASTGPVGGDATFSASAIGTLNGAGASSAQAMSNTIQIGGNANPAQGAFVVNYFLVKYSSCTNAPTGSNPPYTYSSACTTAPASMPPSSVMGLANGNYLSSIADYYVAYYIQITNIFNTTMPILQYSYLFMDPGVSTEAYSFLVGTNKTMAGGAYYPNYSPPSPRIPTLVSYPADCNLVNGKNVPTDSNCIYVKPGQSVILTFAACGWGSNNWVWGGTPYASKLDSTTGCVSTPPEYQNPTTGALQVPEGETLAVVLSYPYKGQAYSQVLPFEGQTLTNIRTTSTSVSCAPSSDPVSAPSTCTVTVTDTSASTPITPTGTVTLSASPSSGGTLSNGGTCTLGGSGATATCSLTYTPALGQESPPPDIISASYPGDASHSASSGQASVSAIQRTTSTGVVCTPSSAVPNTPTNCVITVSDTSPGTAATPVGSVTLTDSPASSGTFTPAASCTLSSGSCSVTYTPKSNLVGTVTITAKYNGDFDHASSTGSASVTWSNKKATTTSVSCIPTTFGTGSTSVCTATLSGFLTPVTGETITFSQIGGTGSVTFVSTTCTLSSGGTCFVNVLGNGAGTATIQASYPGDSQNAASTGSQTVTITSKHPAGLVQTKTICTDPGSSTCSTSLTVTSGDVMVVAVSTERDSGSCITVNTVTGTRGEGTYTSPSNNGSVSASHSGGFGGSPCTFSAVYYGTVTSSGSDTVTVNLSNNPNHGIAVVYEVSSILTPPTAASRGCSTSGFGSNCPTAMQTPSLSVAANSFLVTTGAVCPDGFGSSTSITSGPSGFTASYGTGQAEYVGYQLPTSSGSQSFQMTTSTNSYWFGSLGPSCTTLVGLQFVDPPPPPGWNSTALAQGAGSAPSFPRQSSDSASVGSTGLASLTLVLLLQMRDCRPDIRKPHALDDRRNWVVTE